MQLNPDERPGLPIAKFESMLKTDDVYFFDSEDFEDIIHYYLNNGKVSLAKKAIKIGLQQHPDVIELKLLDIEVLVFENKLEQAEQMLDSLQLLNHSNEEIYIQRANIFSKQDNHEAAIELLKKALDLSNDSFDIYSLLGMEYLFLDDYEMAKQSFQQCVSFDPQDYSSLYNVIYCFEFLEDYNGAINYLNNYLERNPYCEVAWHQLGKIYFEKNMYKEALSAYDFAIISDDRFIGAYFEKGKVLEKLGKYNEAIENYETTISIDDPTSYAYLRIGKCHEKLNNNDLAKYYFYHTVHEDPLLDKGWLAITNFYYRNEDYEKALYYINKAINIDEENPVYWKKCAKINKALKKYDEADFAYKQSVDLGNYELDTWMSWADVMLLNKDEDSAIQILLQGLEFYPEKAALKYKLAGASILINDLDKAKDYLLEALKTNFKKLSLFKEDFPELYKMELIKNIILEFKKTSN